MLFVTSNNNFFIYHKSIALRLASKESTFSTEFEDKIQLKTTNEVNQFRRSTVPTTLDSSPESTESIDLVLLRCFSAYLFTIMLIQLEL